MVLSCAATLIWLGFFRPQPAPSKPFANTPYPYTVGLSLDQVRFVPDGPHRRIVGVLRNGTDQPQKNVTIRFNLWTRIHGQLGFMEAVVPLAPAKADAEFRTEPVPDETVRWDIGGIASNP